MISKESLKNVALAHRSNAFRSARHKKVSFAKENWTIFFHVGNLLINLVVHVTRVVSLACLSIDLQFKIYVVGILDQLLANQVTQNEETILDLRLEPRCATFDGFAQLVLVCHVKQEHVSAHTVYPRMLTPKPIENHTELNFMHDIFRAAMVRNSELSTLLQHTKQIDKSLTENRFFQDLPAKRLVEHHGVDRFGDIWVGFVRLSKEVFGNTVALRLILLRCQFLD